jgi:hypothetical protein
MKSSWQSETGRLACHWFGLGSFLPYRPQWMQEAQEMSGPYLPPVPDFASHSPFAGADWFEPHRAAREQQ